MVKLILLGLLAGALFSSTFILNEAMSNMGGHWFWSASLRYSFMWLMLSALIAMQHGFGRLRALTVIFGAHWRFWCLTGSIGFGVFYTGICYAGDHVAGWVVAATFMFTVVTSLLVLLAFGQRFDKKFIAYALLVFIGVVLVNVSEGLRASAAETVANTSISEMLLLGALPALLAAFCYPIGNQLVWQISYNSRQYRAEHLKRHESTIVQSIEPLVTEAPILLSLNSEISSAINHNDNTSYSMHSQTAIDPTTNSQTQLLLQRLINRIPTVDTDLLQNAFNKVWLMSLGSLPFWLVLGIIVRPEAPSGSQVVNTLLVAVLAGIGATSIFFYARERALTSSEVAGVDATQASEVIFALIGGMLFLSNALPSALGLIGIGLIILGLILFAKDG